MNHVVWNNILFILIDLSNIYGTKDFKSINKKPWFIC